MSEDISLFHGVAWYAVFLFSTTVHEASHAFAALKLGDDTAHRGGQVTLDPTPHIKREPVGMVAVPILSYLFGGWMMGWASVPYDPQWANRYPRRAALMSMAGPASNLALLMIAALLIRLGISFGYFSSPDSIHFGNVVEAAGRGVPHLAAVLLSITFSLNLILFCFNLVPLPPLDGSALPLFFLNEEQSIKYSAFLAHPGIAMFGLFVAWKIFGALYSPIHLFAINLLYPGLDYR
ncbi:MAG: site-2 protease family protein [Verrucomicrobiota bacterium]